MDKIELTSLIFLFAAPQGLYSLLLIDRSAEALVVGPPEPGLEADERSLGVGPYRQHGELFTMHHDAGLAVGRGDTDLLYLVIFKNPCVRNILLITNGAA